MWDRATCAQNVWLGRMFDVSGKRKRRRKIIGRVKEEEEAPFLFLSSLFLFPEGSKTHIFEDDRGHAQFRRIKKRNICFFKKRTIQTFGGT